jgi:AhpD family alkylhydroperoxidase
MHARMKHPAFVLPEAFKAMQALHKATDGAGISEVTHELVRLRASQINGCSVCVPMHAGLLRKAGESDERIFSVAAWRDTPYFTDAERAALALAESMTRLADKEDPVPDNVWNEAAKHYDEKALSALMVSIATINVWNRLNATVRHVAGQKWN